MRPAYPVKNLNLRLMPRHVATLLVGCWSGVQGLAAENAAGAGWGAHSAGMSTAVLGV